MCPLMVNFRSGLVVNGFSPVFEIGSGFMVLSQAAILILTLKWVLDQWDAQRNRGMGADGDAGGTPARW